jgi:hypothetical protein
MSIIGKVKRTGQTGHRTSDNIFFEAVFDCDPNIEDVYEAQKIAGYHPGGYGGPGDIRKKQVADCFVVTWCCYASCD